jgi:serpin B
MRLDEQLSGARVTARWLDAADVEAAARRRRRRGRRVWVAGGVVLAAVAAAVLVPTLTTSSGTHPSAACCAPPLGPGVVVGDRLGDGVELVSDAQPTSVGDPAAIGPVATAEQSLSLALLRELQKDSGTANVSVSPASLAVALAMLQNGAAGTTLAQIQRALHSTGLTTAQQNAGWAALAAAWEQAAADGHLTLDSANSLFLQRGFPVEPAFLAALRSGYHAGTWQVDFAHQLPGAVDTINAWTAQQTHGRIAKLFEDGQLDDTTVAVLADAVYFHAAWSRPFDPHESTPGVFHGAAGPTRPTFMTQAGGTLPWAVGDGYQAVELPYTGGRFAALAVMPTTGSLGRFVAGLTPDRLAGIAAALHTGAAAVVTLPRFSTTSALDLRHALAALGMPDAFTSRADFSALSSVPTNIQSVEQRVYLAVGEKGTEAAAVTGIGMQATSAFAGRSLTFDHPFLFLVRDTVTGAILFASLVQNPMG